MLSQAVAIVSLVIPLMVCAGETPQGLPASNWGGDHVGIEVTAEGARLEFDCAHGTIDAAIRLDEEGRFDVRGAFVRERPGPVRPEGDRSEPARYWGRVEKDSMTLNVEMANTDEKIGTFTLERGRLPRIRKCQ